jgi:hypothetical protein
LFRIFILSSIKFLCILDSYLHHHSVLDKEDTVFMEFSFRQVIHRNKERMESHKKQTEWCVNCDYIIKSQNQLTSSFPWKVIFFFFNIFWYMVDFIPLITWIKLKFMLAALLVRYSWTFISLATGALIHVKLDWFHLSVDYIFTVNVLCYVFFFVFFFFFFFFFNLFIF